MEGFENTMTNSANEVRTRRKRFFCFILAFMMAVVTPKMDVFAADVSLGNIFNAEPATPFDAISKYGTHILPGEKIQWGIGDSIADNSHIDFTVDYIVGNKTYTDNATIEGGTTGKVSGGDAEYTAKSLATVSAGEDTRMVDYWALTKVLVNNDETVITACSYAQVNKIVLTAHFAATPVPPKGKTDEVLTLVGGGEDKGPQLPPHEHAYTWIKTRETTEEVDGEWSYKCECGDVKYRIPESGAFAFIRNAIDNINKTPQGGTVEIKTRRWLVFNKAVADAISDRPDVTIKLSYLEGGYKGDGLTTTLPAGTDLHQYLDEKGYVGFLFLKTIFPTERTLWNK